MSRKHVPASAVSRRAAAVGDHEPNEPQHEALLDVDPDTGFLRGGKSTLQVPEALGREINAARRRLQSNPMNPRLRRRALVPAAPASEPEEDEDDEPPVRDLRPPPATNYQAPVRPASGAAPSAEASLLADRPARLRTADGHFVPVIRASEFVQAQARADRLRPGIGARLPASEARMLEDCRVAGGYRRVGLKRAWAKELAQLRADMPNFAGVVDRIHASCVLAKRTGRPLRIPPLLLFGRPGLGKSYFASRVAQVLGVENFVYHLESAETTSVLAGSERHWGNTEPGALWRLIVQGGQANPVIVLDELDKAPQNANYRPTSALHAVLEPLTAKQLRDKSMDITFDASYAVYLATANRLSPIEASLLSRFEIVLIEEAGPAAAVSIARGISRGLWKELGLKRLLEPPKGEIVQQLALLGAPRRMHQVLRAAVGRALSAGRDVVLVCDLFAAGRSGDGGPASRGFGGGLQ